MKTTMKIFPEDSCFRMVVLLSISLLLPLFLSVVARITLLVKYLGHTTTRAKKRGEMKSGGAERERERGLKNSYSAVLHGKAQVVVFRGVVVAGVGLGTRPFDQVLDVRRRDGTRREAQGELECLQLLILPALHFFLVVLLLL